MTRLALDANGQVIQAISQGIVQNVAFDASSASLAFANETQMIRVCATVDCYILITKAGTAVTSANGSLLPAGTVEYWGVAKNAKLTAIKVGSTGGIISITEGGA